MVRPTGFEPVSHPRQNLSGPTMGLQAKIVLFQRRFIFEIIQNNLVMWGNKKLRLESIKLQSGYETHAVSSILNWLEDE